MKLRHIISAFILILTCAGISHAQTPLMRYGVEWGFAPNISYDHHTNFITEDGYRVDSHESGMCFAVNSYLLGSIGINVGKHFDVNLLSGYAGIGKNNRVIPVLLRAGYHLKKVGNDTPFCFIDGGFGFHTRKEGEPYRKPAITTDAGIGYRLVLTRRSSIDFVFNGKWTFDSLLITDPNSGNFIQESNIRDNKAFYLTLSLGVRVNF